MKIAIPHMGNLWIPVKILMEQLDLEYVIPSLNNATTLKKGVNIAPEEMCMPFKLMVGNFIECWEKGADTAIMAATKGPCRLGSYADLMQTLFDDSGMHMNWIIPESPECSGIIKPLQTLNSIEGNKHHSTAAKIKYTSQCIHLMREIDKAEQQFFFIGGYLKNPQECIYLRKNMLRALGFAKSFAHAGSIIESYINRLQHLKVNKEKPVSVLLTGEIFTVTDSYSCHNIEETLMNMGVSFQKSISISWWMDNALQPKIIKNKNYSKYLPCNIGGYASDTVSDFVSYKQMGFDGVIHILPSGCMPEIVSKTAAIKVKADCGAQIMHLVFDEMTGEEGYVTRIEAFTDMLRSKRRSKE